MQITSLGTSITEFTCTHMSENKKIEMSTDLSKETTSLNLERTVKLLEKLAYTTQLEFKW